MFSRWSGNGNFTLALLAPQEGGNNVGVWDARTGAMRFSFTLKNMTVLLAASRGGVWIGHRHSVQIVQNEASMISFILLTGSLT